MKIRKTTCLLLFVATIFACSQADAFFGRNRALPSAIYYANYNDPYFGATGPFAGYEADTVFIAPTRGYSPFNYRYWNRSAAVPVVENGYATGVVNGCYNAEYEPCCGDEVVYGGPVYSDYYVGVDAYFPAPRPFQPVRNVLHAVKSLFTHHRQPAFYDPCWPVCDPCFACCDPCFSCCDPCGFAPCCGFAEGSTGSCCGADDLGGDSINMNNGVPATTSGTVNGENAAPTRIDSSVSPTPSIPQQAAPNDSTIIGPDTILQNNQPAPQTPINNNQTGIIRMTVPADSVVYINGYQTKLSGTERNFTANDLVPGQTYSFEIRVVAVRNGQTLEEVKTASLIAGSTSSIAFSDFENQGLQEIALLK